MDHDPEILSFTLGYPPTGNTSVRHAHGSHWLSPKAKAYFSLMRFELLRQGATVRLQGRLKVDVDIHPPDRRKRDLDNAWKIAGDACTRAGVWEDDSQIDWLVLRRMESVDGGIVKVRVTVLDPEG